MICWGIIPPCGITLRNASTQVYYDTHNIQITYISKSDNLCIMKKHQWEYICKHFEINTIPHYMVVDKSGKIIDPKSPIDKSNGELKEMLMKLIVQYRDLFLIE